MHLGSRVATFRRPSAFLDAPLCHAHHCFDFFPYLRYVEGSDFGAISFSFADRGRRGRRRSNDQSHVAMEVLDAISPRRAAVF